MVWNTTPLISKAIFYKDLYIYYIWHEWYSCITRIIKQWFTKKNLHLVWSWILEFGDTQQQSASRLVSNCRPFVTSNSGVGLAEIQIVRLTIDHHHLCSTVAGNILVVLMWTCHFLTSSSVSHTKILSEQHTGLISKVENQKVKCYLWINRSKNVCFFISN